MRELTFYRAWLLVPIALPILVIVLGPFTPDLAEPWLTIEVYLFLSLPFGGLPYVILALLVWYWLPDRPAWRVRLVALGLPLPMIVVNESLVHGPSWFVVGMAYGYVAIFLLTEQGFRTVGWVEGTNEGKSFRHDDCRTTTYSW